MKSIFSFSDENLSFNPELISLEKYNQAFCRRTEELRLESGYSDITIFAELLGLSARQYAKHEATTPLPHSLIPLFCSITKTEISGLFPSFD